MANEKNVQVLHSQDPFDQLFDTFLPGVFRPMRWEGTQPVSGIASIDVLDRENELVVRAEVAGVDKDNLDIQVHGNQVYISGEKSEEADKEGGKYIYRERRYGNFSRTIQLPVEVDSGQARASYTNGVLELVLPKAEAAKRRKVSIE